MTPGHLILYNKYCYPCPNEKSYLTLPCKYNTFLILSFYIEFKMLIRQGDEVMCTSLTGISMINGLSDKSKYIVLKMWCTVTDKLTESR